MRLLVVYIYRPKSDFLKYTDVVNFHLLRENSRCIWVPGPSASYRNIENEKELLMKLGHMIGCNVNNIKLDVINKPPDVRLIPND